MVARTSSTSLLLSVLATAALVADAAAEVHSVKVGPELTFTPDTVTAADGDWVEFTFGAGHSVAESSFDAPCVPIASGPGVFSGFPNNGDVWRIQINGTDPLWLYCSVTGHCEGGMAMVVNPPSSGNTLDAYKSAASGISGSSPSTVQGGVFGALSDDSSSASSSAGSSASAAASSAASSAAGSSASAAATSASGGSKSSASATVTASGSSASKTGAATGNSLSNGLLLAGAVAAGVAAVL